MTLVFAALDPGAGTLEYVNAGHPAPVVVRADGSVERLERGGVVLGVVPDGRYEAASVPLRPNDVVAFFTDGVTEALGPDGALYGEERLIAYLTTNRGADPVVLIERLVADVRAFEGSRGASDDLTVVILRVDGGASGSPRA